MKPTARRALTVSSDRDRHVRRFLEEAGRKGDLSRFVEDAVKARMLEMSMNSVPKHGRSAANEVGAEAVDLIKAAVTASMVGEAGVSR
jgi:hypothetical protein